MRLDHLVLTVSDIEQTIQFYRRVLGCEVLDEAAGRAGQIRNPALAIGAQKINVHGPQTGASPVAGRPTVGAGDLCFVWEGPIAGAVEHLRACEVTVELGPIGRRGAAGPGQSVYFRDPDNNLLELISYAMD